MGKNRKGGISQAEVRKMIDRRVNAALSLQAKEISQAADNVDNAGRYAESVASWASSLHGEGSKIEALVQESMKALSKQQGQITKALKTLEAQTENLGLFNTFPPAPALPDASPAHALITSLKAEVASLTEERDNLARQVGTMAEELVTLKAKVATGVPPHWLSKMAQKDRHTNDDLIDGAKRALRWAGGVGG